MAGDWKTLTAVVLAAAIAGWLMVRMLTGSRAPHDPEAPTRVAMEPSPAASPVASAAVEATSAPTAPRATNADAQVVDRGTDAETIVRDLETLTRALVRDQRIEDRVLPRVDDGLEVPGVTTYRRAPDFWEPALGGSEGANR